VAIYTCILDRGVNELPALECVGLVRMAAEANLVPVCEKELRELALMRIVAGIAASNGNRTVDKIAAGHGLVVALEAKRASGGAKLEFVGGLMWIVALGAFPFLDRRMDDLLSGHRFVAPVAKRGHVAYRLEGMLAGRCMTGSTFTHCHGSMNELILPHGGVTCFGYT
jgi:hypothetical protein